MQILIRKNANNINSWKYKKKRYKMGRQNKAEICERCVESKICQISLSQVYKSNLRRVRFALHSPSPFSGVFHEKLNLLDTAFPPLSPIYTQTTQPIESNFKPCVTSTPLVSIWVISARYARQSCQGDRVSFQRIMQSKGRESCVRCVKLNSRFHSAVPYKRHFQENQLIKG